jgi:hypothetical protein
MSKQHLSIFVIIAVSLIMGGPVFMADAATPVKTISLSNDDLCGYADDDHCLTDPLATPTICGDPIAILHFQHEITETRYDNGMVKYVETRVGDVWDENKVVIGTFDDILMKIYNSDNIEINPNVDKMMLKVNCVNGEENEILIEMTTQDPLS